MDADGRRIITWRSVGLGLLIALGVAVVTPYNDYVVNNSFIVGNFFPPIVTLAVLAVVLLVNGPLHKFAPRGALSPGELALTMAMALIACSVPSQGLFRMIVPLPVVPSHFTDDAAYARVFADMKLPRTLWAADPAVGSGDRVVSAFYGRLLPGERLPWGAWAKPLLAWGSFGVFFFTALFALACVLRFQWTVNERLPFPIAQLQTMLVAPPAKGRALNDVFSSRLFWAALLFVVAVESSTPLHLYFPQSVPEIHYRYDMTQRLAEAPWTYLPGWLKAGTIYFTFLGVSYFISVRVSFSLWGTPLVVALLFWALDPTKAVVSDAAMADQTLGASFAFLAGVLWIGRAHWAVVVRALFGRPRPTDARGAFVPYRWAAALLVVGVLGMFVWLLVVGVQVWLAAAIVVMCLMAHVITARVVAETGMACLRCHVPFDTMLRALPANLLTPRDAFFYGVGHYGYMQSARESELVYALHGLNVIDATQPPGADTRRGTAAVLGGTLAVTLIAAAVASLWCYYAYAQPLVPDDSGLLNRYGLHDWPKLFLVDFPTQVAGGAYPATGRNVWAHVATGLGVMVVLQALTWRFAAWPLLPVGFLVSTSWYVQFAWFSLVLGWGAKVLVLRFGGAKLYGDLKPLFVGLIFGEALTIGLWLVVTLVLALSGEAFRVVLFLPR